MINIQENNIEWLSGQKKVSAYITQERFKNKIRTLANEHPELCNIIQTNDDGSMFCHIDISCVKISAPRQLTDEQREAAAERLKIVRERKTKES